MLNSSTNPEYINTNSDAGVTTPQQSPILTNLYRVGRQFCRPELHQPETRRTVYLGSSRLGYHIGGYPVNAYDNGPDAYWNYFYGSESSWYRGGKVYELTNHLGNVLVTVSDENTGIPLATDSSLIDHYTAQMNSSTDYYPFGMQMPARNWNSSYYRYGFNGQ